MMRTWQMLGFSALLAAALTASPAVAEQKDDSKKLDDILKQLGEIQKSLDGLANVPKDLTDAKINIAKGQADILQLKDQLTKLQRDLDELRKQVNSTTRIAAFPPTGASGRIRLMNTFSQGMSIRVNDRVYRLEPGQTQMLDSQPIGAFTYEVLGVQAPVTRTLAAGETYTIYVYPR